MLICPVAPVPIAKAVPLTLSMSYSLDGGSLLMSLHLCRRSCSCRACSRRSLNSADGAASDREAAAGDTPHAVLVADLSDVDGSVLVDDGLLRAELSGVDLVRA